MTPPTFTRIEFINFKAFKRFSVPLDHINLVVGPNNSGKSTILAAFRVLEIALRRARARNPERILDTTGRYVSGYPVPKVSLPISTENIWTDHDNVPARIVFRLSNGNTLEVHFPPAGQFFLTADTPKGPPATTSRFKSMFPINIITVPQLSPVEHEEDILEKQTVENGLVTHRASRHFRNYWRFFPERFDEFADLLRKTWPGMDISKPEIITGTPTLAMYCRENRMPRELFWAGSGFQIWCQLLTHITRAKDATLLVIDEPEIYLHPDVQRQLLGLLRTRGVDVLLATHSTEIVGEADPDEILLVEKSRTAARRIRDVEGVQAALDSIGSIHNIALAQLARTGRLVFMEGAYDSKLIRQFAGILGFPELSAGAGMTHAESDGFAGWERIRDFAWGIQKTVGTGLQIAVVLDRDFFPQEQINDLLGALRTHVAHAVVLERKEIENYLLVPHVMQRAVDRLITDAGRRGHETKGKIDIQQTLLSLTDPLKTELQGQFLGKRWEYLRSSGRDIGSVNRETLEWFESHWCVLQQRLCIVPGKAVLAALRNCLKQGYGISLTDHRILGAFKKEDVPRDMALVVRELETFRVCKGTAQPS